MSDIVMLACSRISRGCGSAISPCDSTRCSPRLLVAPRPISIFSTPSYVKRSNPSNSNARRWGLSIAHFPSVKTLDDFDFKSQPSIDQRLVRELATGRFIAQADNVLLLGPPGVGKTHLAIPVGRAAVEPGHSVLFTSATALLGALARAGLDGQLAEKLTFFAKPKLLIIDELGYLPFESVALIGATEFAAALVFNAVTHRTIAFSDNRSDLDLHELHRPDTEVVSGRQSAAGSWRRAALSIRRLRPSRRQRAGTWPSDSNGGWPATTARDRSNEADRHRRWDGRAGSAARGVAERWGRARAKE